MAAAESTREREYRKSKRGQRKVLEGRVSSTKMENTVVVEIERTEKHRKYHKYIRRHSKLYAHDPKALAGVGDIVRVVECRPMSKLKRFLLLDVVKKSRSSA